MNKKVLILRNIGIFGIGLLCGIVFRGDFFEQTTLQATGETVSEELVTIATTTKTEIATTTDAIEPEQILTELLTDTPPSTESVLHIQEEVPPLDQKKLERLPSPAPQVNPESLLSALNSITCHSEPLLSQYDNPGACMRAAQF